MEKTNADKANFFKQRFTLIYLEFIYFCCMMLIFGQFCEEFVVADLWLEIFKCIWLLKHGCCRSTGALSLRCAVVAKVLLLVLWSLQDGSLFSFIGIFHYKFIKFISLKLFFGRAQLMKVSARCQ